MFKSKKTVIREQDEQLRNQAAQIQELQARLVACESAYSNLQADAATMREREESVVRTLREATHAAVRIKDDARAEADAVREKLKQDVDEAKKETETLLDVAYQNARDIVREAEEQNRLTMDATQNTVHNYSLLLHQFHERMRQNAEQAQDHAAAYAELMRRMYSELPVLPEAELLALLNGTAPTIAEQKDDTPPAEPPTVQEQPLDEPEADEKVWKVDDITVDAILNAGSDEELLALIDSVMQKNRE